MKAGHILYTCIIQDNDTHYPVRNSPRCYQRITRDCCFSIGNIILEYYTIEAQISDGWSMESLIDTRLRKIRSRLGCIAWFVAYFRGLTVFKMFSTIGGFDDSEECFELRRIFHCLHSFELSRSVSWLGSSHFRPGTRCKVLLFSIFHCKDKTWSSAFHRSHLMKYIEYSLSKSPIGYWESPFGSPCNAPISMTPRMEKRVAIIISKMM